MGFFSNKPLTLKQKEKLVKAQRKAAKIEKDYRKFNPTGAERFSSNVDESYGRVSNASGRLLSGVSGVRPRIRGDNLSRQVLTDSYRLDTDITRKR